MAFGLLSVLPLLFGYEYLALRASQEHMLQVRNGADVILRTLFQIIGIHSPFYLGLGLILAIGIAIKWRRKGTTLHSRYFLYTIVESTVYAVALTFILTAMTQRLLFSMQTERSFHADLMLALGAGVYEELVFRFFLFGNTVLILLKLTHLTPWMAYAGSAILSSVLFSMAHYMGFEPFTLYSAVFRFLAGLLFCFIYHFRGLGIAAWTHTLYDFFLII